MKNKSLKERLQKLAGVKKPLHEQQGISPTWSDLGYDNGWPPLIIPWSPTHLPEDPYGYDGPNEAIISTQSWYDCDEAEYFVNDQLMFPDLFDWILENNIPLDTQFSKIIFKGSAGGGSGVYQAADDYQAGYAVTSCTVPNQPSKRFKYIRSRHFYVDGEPISGNRKTVQEIYDAILANVPGLTQEEISGMNYDELSDFLGGLTSVCLSMTGTCGGHCVCRCYQEDNCLAPVYGCLDELAENYMHSITLDYVGSNQGNYGQNNQYILDYAYNPYVNIDFSEFEPNEEANYWNQYNANGSCYYNPGCTDETAINYDSSADFDDGSCIPTIIGCMDENALNYNPSANISPEQYIENGGTIANIEFFECEYIEDQCLDLAGTLLGTSVSEETIDTICTNFCQPVSGIGTDGDPYTFDWMALGSAQYAGETGGPTGEIENPLLYQFCTNGCCDLEYSSAPRYDCSPNGCIEVQEYGAFSSLQACIDSGCSGEFIWTGCNSFADWLTSVSIEDLGGISEEVFCNNCFENTPMGDAQQLWGDFFNEQCNCCDGFTVYDQCQNIDNLYISIYCNYANEEYSGVNNDWLDNNFIPGILSAYPNIGECCDTPSNEKKAVAPSAIVKAARSLGIPLPKGDTVQRNPETDRMQKLAGIPKPKK